MRRFVRALAPVVRPPARLAVAVTFVAAVLVSSARPAQAAEPFRFTESTMQVGEGQALARVVVERTDLPVSRETVDYRTEAVTATEGEDFAGVAGRLVFEVGERQAVVIVYLRDDDIAEHREHFVVQLHGRASASASVMILDDDGAVDEPAGATDRSPAPAAAAAAPAPALDGAAVAAAPAPRAEVARRPVVASRPASATPRRVTVRQSPVTPFELRPAPGHLQPSVPGAVDPAVALLAGLLLAKVAAEVWFRARVPAS